MAAYEKICGLISMSRCPSCKPVASCAAISNKILAILKVVQNTIFYACIIVDRSIKDKFEIKAFPR
jgi:hypothetical protein